MVAFAFGAFIVLHGLVHLLYFAQGRRFFELAPGLRWPDGSWAFARLLGDAATRRLAAVTCLAAAAAFVVGAAGLLLGQQWWRPVVIGSGVFSALVFALFWDGTRRKLSAQGWIGVLIDVAVLAVVLVAGWPSVAS